MLELAKKILQKVSFDPYLFKKELLKAIKSLNNNEELMNLKNWCQMNFGKSYPMILQEAFA